MCKNAVTSNYVRLVLAIANVPDVIAKSRTDGIRFDEDVSKFEASRRGS